MRKMAAIIFASVCFTGISSVAAAGPGDLPSSSGIIALNSVPNPSATLATATVADAKGTMVGAVRKIVLDTNGTPKSVDVALMGSHAVVSIDAARFNYDQGHNVLTAQLDANQIAAAPAAPPG